MVGSTGRPNQGHIFWLNKLRQGRVSRPFAIWFAESMVVLVAPDLPVFDVPMAAAIIASSIDRPMAAAASGIGVWDQ